MSKAFTSAILNSSETTSPISTPTDGRNSMPLSLMFRLCKEAWLPLHEQLTSVNKGNRAAGLFSFQPGESMAASIRLRRFACTGSVSIRVGVFPKALRKVPTSSVAVSITMAAA